MTDNGCRLEQTGYPSPGKEKHCQEISEFITSGILGQCGHAIGNLGQADQKCFYGFGKNKTLYDLGCKLEQHHVSAYFYQGFKSIYNTGVNDLHIQIES